MPANPTAPPELVATITRIIELEDEQARRAEEISLLRKAVAAQFAEDGAQDLTIEGIGKVSYRAGYTSYSFADEDVERLYNDLTAGDPLRHQLDRVRRLVPKYDGKKLELLYQMVKDEDAADALTEARKVRVVEATVAIRKEH